MPTQTTITENYWTTCYVKILFANLPYPCKKQRTITKFCYTFNWYKKKCIFFNCTEIGCENGILYQKISRRFSFYEKEETDIKFTLCTTQGFTAIGTC